MIFAETYRGNGRLTGRTSDTPEGNDWAAFDGTADEFHAAFIWQQHDHCHIIAVWDCPHCEQDAESNSAVDGGGSNVGDEF